MFLGFIANVFNVYKNCATWFSTKNREKAVRLGTRTRGTKGRTAIASGMDNDQQKECGCASEGTAAKAQGGEGQQSDWRDKRMFTSRKGGHACAVSFRITTFDMNPVDVISYFQFSLLVFFYLGRSLRLRQNLVLILLMLLILQLKTRKQN